MDKCVAARMNCPRLEDLPEPPAGMTGWPWTEESPQVPDTMPDGRPWPRITIVTPSYNQSQFIEETIRSVLLQGYPNLEYIVMDGGSYDGSVEIIRRYAQQVSHWESGPDGGQAAAIAKGFGKATGEILAWLNSDDCYLPGCLHTVAQVFKSRPALDFLVGSWVEVDESGHVIECHWPVTPNIPWLLEGGCFVGQPACFWTRRAYERAGGIDTSFRFSMDYDLWLRILQCSHAASTTRPLASFRVHGTSKSTSWQDIRIAEDRILRKRFKHQDLPQWKRSLLRKTRRLAMAIRRRTQWIPLWRQWGEARPWVTRHDLRPEMLLPEHGKAPQERRQSLA